MHAVRTDSGRQRRVCAGQHDHAAPPRSRDQRPPLPDRRRIAERSVDDTGAARQPGDHGQRVGRPDRIGEEEESRQGLSSDARRP
jgi:hypothetical protein